MPDTPRALHPGDVIGGRYLLSTPLGEGGMASVWRATDATRDVDVAIKFVNAVGARAADLVTCFAREADLSERMLSRNIVRVLDRGTEPQPYMVLELLQGETLSQRLGRSKLGAAEAISVVTQICRALERAHGVGVVHRDIKPDNVFLCPEDGKMLVKVLDFGVSALGLKDVVRDTSREGFTGTIGYMSPEHMLEGVESDERSDLFSLGVVAYECFTGRIPFADKTLADYIMSVSNKPPRAPSTIRLDLPPGLDDWMTRSLAFDRRLRFSSARAMADALTEVHKPMVQAAITASRRARARSLPSAVPRAPSSKPPRSRPPARLSPIPPPKTTARPPRASKPPRSTKRPEAAQARSTKRPEANPVEAPPRSTRRPEAKPEAKPQRSTSKMPTARPAPIVPATSYSHVEPRAPRPRRSSS